MSYEYRGIDLYHEGKKIHLNGVNLGSGFELKEMVPFVLGWGGKTIKEMVADIKAMGYNAVRVPIHPRVLRNPELPDKGMLKDGDKKYTKALDLLDAVLNELQTQGLRFMLDHHYLDKNGKIPHLWYDADYSSQQWYDDLRFMAERWKGMRAYYALNTKNEPNNNPEGGITWGDGNLARDWKAACEEAANIISNINPDIIVVHETGGTVPGIDQMLDLKVNWAKNAASHHPYGPDAQRDWFAGAKSPDFPKNMPAEWDKIFGNAARKVPYVAGEYGGRYGIKFWDENEKSWKYGWGGDKDKVWQDAFVAYAKERGFATFYWTYGPDSGDTGGMLSEDRKTWQQPKVDLIRRLNNSFTTYLDAKTIDPVKPTIPETKNIKAGDQVKFITGEGPKMVVRSVGQDKAEVSYFPPYTQVSIPLSMLMK